MFHRYEVALCGYSGSGKTTLAAKLLEDLSKRFRVSYVKHDVHCFQMDKSGKDTAIAWEAGAHTVSISDRTHTATIKKEIPSLVEMSLEHTDSDILILEGWKNTEVPKLVLLGGKGNILPRINREIKNILAVVGPDVRPASLDPSVRFIQRDCIKDILDTIVGDLEARIPPLNGLILAGGRSKRMGRDKALLKYGDQTQIDRAHSLLSECCEEVFLSCRPGQYGNSDVQSHGLKRIDDRFIDMGPLGGILSAMQSDRNSAWLVIACDLPFLTTEALEKLILERDSFRYATCFSSEHSEFPEPLCAIYEPKAFERLLTFLGMGYECPRKFLINSRIHEVRQPNPRNLDNVNHFHEYQRAIQSLGSEGRPQ